DASSPPAQDRCQHRPRGVVRAQWHRRSLEGVGLPEHLGAGRGVRRPGPLVVPDWCLSQLRERIGFGRGRLWTRAARQAGRRQRSRLLLTTDSRRSHRFVRPDQDLVTMTAKTASEYAASRSTVSFLSRTTRPPRGAVTRAKGLPVSTVTYRKVNVD